MSAPQSFLEETDTFPGKITIMMTCVPGNAVRIKLINNYTEFVSDIKSIDKAKSK